MTTLFTEMWDMGYRLVPVADEVYQDIDIAIAENMHCKKCGGKMTWEGYETPVSYRSFAVCTKCGHYEEF